MCKVISSWKFAPFNEKVLFFSVPTLCVTAHDIKHVVLSLFFWWIYDLISRTVDIGDAQYDLLKPLPINLPVMFVVVLERSFSCLASECGVLLDETFCYGWVLLAKICGQLFQGGAKDNENIWCLATIGHKCEVGVANAKMSSLLVWRLFGSK